MKILAIDPIGCANNAVDFCMRADRCNHDVRLWIPKHAGEVSPLGNGLVSRVDEWQAWMDWADLIVLFDNAKYRDELETYFKRGYPIFGCNKESAELELNREVGQEVLKSCGVELANYEVCNTFDKAMDYVREMNCPLACKPWGGASDKSLSYVSKSAADMLFKLAKWKKEKTNSGQLMMQEVIKGVEVAVGGWFGPGGWSRMVCENFEEKAFMNEGLGGNTGEQGTVLRYVRKSKLFDQVLEPLTDHLHQLNYVGYCDVNTIVDKEGCIYPLEFTMRFGCPTFMIQQALHQGDCAEWMKDLLEGRDTLRTSKEIALGIVMTHGDYPHSQMAHKELQGFPIYGITTDNEDSLHYSDVMIGVAPAMVCGSPQDVSIEITAGDYVLVVTGTGASVREAQREAYGTAWGISWPSNRMFRTDLGDRLRKQLPLLQQRGFAVGMEF